MPRRLSSKLIVSLTVIVILINVVAGVVYLRVQNQHTLETMILGADQLSKSITSATWHAMKDDHRSAAYDIMSVIAAKQGVDRIRMFNREGRLMFSTKKGDNAQLMTVNEQPCVACHGSMPVKVEVAPASRVRIYSGTDGRDSLNMVTPIYNEASCSQADCHAHPARTRVLGVLDVALSLDPVRQEEAAMTQHTVVTTGITILLTAVFIFFFVRYFVGVPIRELIEGTHAVSEMELGTPIRISHSSEEMDALVTSFNTMRDRLQGAMDEINTFTQSLEKKVEDRTQQLKAAQQKLLHNDRLASLGQLAASVAHEINNPVSGVLNLAMLMQRILKDDGVPPNRLADFRKYLGQVATETARVGRIVSDLLAFSRRSKPQRTPADLNRIIRSTLTLAAHKLKLCDTEVEVDLPADLPTVSCDPSQMQQVVLNLVLNAAEATQSKGGGKVLVRTRVAADQKCVEMLVQDNGEGISPENLSKIFDPFFTSKPEGKGVGLGLAVIYGIVQAHDGEIDVKSTVGEGATFTVTIPMESAVKPAAAPAEPVV
ncbi:sensor histidine kinase [Paludibaculum fermentans]|uniref:histidine kinase n=1 Tax=Paludibaculum fermentans TaxID=1473598 RepID=A0A7S7SNG7_PALFE|nr:ATP-binding protein [Paludibaculum fermentans]QOY90100.1 HAMP domain-containing protein [Paludibaculum fermentans]